MSYNVFFWVTVACLAVLTGYAVECDITECPNGWCPFSLECANSTRHCTIEAESPIMDCSKATTEWCNAASSCSACEEQLGCVWCVNPQNASTPQCTPMSNCTAAPVIPRSETCSSCSSEDPIFRFHYIDECTDISGCGFYWDSDGLIDGKAVGTVIPYCVPVDSDFDRVTPRIYFQDDLTFYTIPYLLGGGCVLLCVAGFYIAKDSGSEGIVIGLVAIVVGLCLPTLSAIVGFLVLGLFIVPLCFVLFLLLRLFIPIVSFEEDEKSSGFSIVTQIIAYPFLFVLRMFVNYCKFTVSVVIISFSVGKGLEFSDNLYEVAFEPLKTFLGEFITDILSGFLSTITWFVDWISESAASLLMEHSDPYSCPALQRSIALTIFIPLPFFLITASCLTLRARYGQVAVRCKGTGRVLDYLYGMGLQIMGALVSLLFKLCGVGLSAGLSGLFFKSIYCSFYGRVYSWIVSADTWIMIAVMLFFGLTITFHGFQFAFSIFGDLFSLIAGEELDTPEEGSFAAFPCLLIGLFPEGRLEAYCQSVEDLSVEGASAVLKGVAEGQTLWVSCFPGGYAFQEYVTAVSEYSPLYPFQGEGLENKGVLMSRISVSFQWVAAIVSFCFAVGVVNGWNAATAVKLSVGFVSCAELIATLLMFAYVLYHKHGTTATTAVSEMVEEMAAPKAMHN